MADLIILVIYFGGPLLMLALAFFAGNWIAKRHEAQMALRREALGAMEISDISTYLRPDPSAPCPQMLNAEVTLGIDHFRGFMGRLKNIFGGEVRSYQATLDRARREAILRVMEQAHAEGMNAVANLRVDFVDISGNATMARKASMVTIQASATGYRSEG
jgi:uncharacterized protein YbjQ (UPF0145 family)